MQIFFFSLLFIIAIVACNNTSTDKAVDSKEKTLAEKEGKLSGNSPSNCSNLILFHKGAIIEGASYDASGKEIARQTTAVTDVHTEGNITISNVDMQMNTDVPGGSVIKAAYKCDGNTLYIDLNSLMSNFSAVAGSKTEATPIEFPINIAAGQTLPDASFSIITDKAGKGMKTTALIKDLKVEAKESVTTPAGTWDCYKVSATMDSNVKMEGMGANEQKMTDMMKKNMPVMKTVMWFSPDFGVVKTEMYNNGKLSNRSEITRVKK